MELRKIDNAFSTAGTNRLRQLISGITQNIPSSTYYYDAIGNLVRDYGDTIGVDWNNAGKITTIYQGNNKVSFTYSPTGQRQSKITGNYADFYVHDATGNIMAIYRNTGDTLKLIEKPIYGSSRLGVVKQNMAFLRGGSLFKKDTASIGLRNYELTDHLGNVTITLTDRKFLYSGYYSPDIQSVADYYPFGYPMPDRAKYLESYRFGFNGQESDNEVYGDKQSYTADFWQYDTRLGRRWNIDPKGNPWESPYSTFAGNPVLFKDVLGADTSFTDNAARKDFMTAYNTVNNKINALESQIKAYKENLAETDLKQGTIRRTERKLKNTENDLADWNKLKTDFDNIISSKVMFRYTSDTRGLDDGVKGLTTNTETYSNNKGQVVSGLITIQIVPGFDDYVVHENRHGNQFLEGTHNKPILQKEKDAFIYQRIYNPVRVDALIENAGKMHPKAEVPSMEDMIMKVYLKEIEAERNKK
jgi:hypothetical protein